MQNTAHPCCIDTLTPKPLYFLKQMFILLIISVLISEHGFSHAFVCREGIQTVAWVCPLMIWRSWSIWIPWFNPWVSWPWRKCRLNNIVKALSHIASNTPGRSTSLVTLLLSGNVDARTVIQGFFCASPCSTLTPSHCLSLFKRWLKRTSQWHRGGILLKVTNPTARQQKQDWKCGLLTLASGPYD